MRCDVLAPSKSRNRSTSSAARSAVSIVYEPSTWALTTALVPVLALERLLVRYVPDEGEAHVLTDDLSDVDRLTDSELTAR